MHKEKSITTHLLQASASHYVRVTHLCEVYKFIVGKYFLKYSSRAKTKKAYYTENGFRFYNFH